jgi:hypothetical protein
MIVERPRGLKKQIAYAGRRCSAVSERGQRFGRSALQVADESAKQMAGKLQV